MDAELFPQNNDRIIAQQSQPIRVIVGNPPTSPGRAAPTTTMLISRTPLDAAISATYAAKSTAKLKSKLYDSYVRAIRWATDRIGDAGIIATSPTPAGSPATPPLVFGFAMPEEFSALYIYDLRGNQRQSDWRAEGGKIFDDGSQTGAAILIAVKNPAATGHADPLSQHWRRAIPRRQTCNYREKRTTYHGVGDDFPERRRRPGEPRDEAFSSYTNRRQTRIRRPGHLHRLLRRTQNQPRCLGVQLRCAQLADSMSATIDFYNEQVDAYQRAVAANPELSRSRTLSPTMREAKISWSSRPAPVCNADNVSATSRLIGAWRCTGPVLEDARLFRRRPQRPPRPTALPLLART